MISVVDYGRGNLFSISRALEALGHDFSVSDSPEDIAAASTVIVPGVGAFGVAMNQLEATGQADAIREAAVQGRRVIGICLGMQLLADQSEEFGMHRGLGLIRGEVRHLPEPRINGEEATRIPNIGWRRVQAAEASSLAHTLGASAYFYFVHSYGFYCADARDAAATIDVNGATIAVIVGRGNVWGFQFHPEKSGPNGLALLNRFLCADLL